MRFVVDIYLNDRHDYKEYIEISKAIIEEGLALVLDGGDSFDAFVKLYEEKEK